MLNAKNAMWLETAGTWHTEPGTGTGTGEEQETEAESHRNDERNYLPAATGPMPMPILSLDLVLPGACLLVVYYVLNFFA